MDLRTALNKKISEIKSVLTERINEQVKIDIKNIFVPLFLARAKALYESELVAKEGDIGKEDPTSPSALRSAFYSYLDSKGELLLIVNGTNVLLNREEYLSDMGFPGGPGEKETTPLSLLYFYFAGIIGTYGFLPADKYEAFKGVPYNPEWGRFGKGFFIDRKAYLAVALNRPSAPRFSEIVSPLSGRPGVDVILLGFIETKGNLLDIMRGSVKKVIENYNK